MTVDSIERLADRCLLPGFVGTEPPEWVLRRAAGGLGGVCLYSRNVVSAQQVAALSVRLHAENPGLVIAIDEEGGDVTRLEAAAGSSYPGNLALGAVDDVELTGAVARSIGAELAGAGIDLDLAPVADVNSNPINPVIGVRAFGAESDLVARHTAAWVQGLQSAGVAACVKHFPGHGDTSLDSHLALPVVDEDPHTGALEPFSAAIAAGVRAVMSAHIVVRSSDEMPGTISSNVMTELLRNELGFRGLAVSDGLEMRAIADGVGIVEGTVLALAAGCDLLCIGGGLAGEDIAIELRDAIVAAVKAGRLSEERLVEAAARVDSLAEWRSQQMVGVRADRAIGLAAARRAVRAEGKVRIDGSPVVVQLRSTPSQAAGVVPWGVAEPLAQLGAHVDAISVDETASVDVISAAAGRSLVLVVRNLHRHPWMAAAVEAALAQRPDAILIEMGLPACRPAAANYVRTYGAARVCGIAAAEVLVER
ncbi:MAG: glycoside hydrolase family 3 protein [Chloroflexi bacterium]|nr:MAG: glycoside hydrolase family 3 protein [Chloroflexota bacterium]